MIGFHAAVADLVGLVSGRREAQPARNRAPSRDKKAERPLCSGGLLALVGATLLAPDPLVTPVRAQPRGDAGTAAAASGSATMLSPQAPDWRWLYDYVDQSTNAVAWDRRFNRLIPSMRLVVPLDGIRRRYDIRELILDVFSGPSRTVERTPGGAVALAACMHHFCPDKGMAWVDVEQQRAVFVVAKHLVRESAGYRAWRPCEVRLLVVAPIAVEDLTADFHTALARWIGQEGLCVTGLRRLENGRAVTIAALGPLRPQSPPCGPCRAPE